MAYMMMPLGAQVDFGFGALGDAFKEAAAELRKNYPETGPALDQHLPVLFLERHAVELYQKSAIIILHRVLEIPYGSKGYETEPPLVRFKRNWVSIYTIHSIAVLQGDLETLLAENRASLPQGTAHLWEFPEEVKDKIRTIEDYDPRGTFFRYPKGKDLPKEAEKSSMKNISLEELKNRIRSGVGYVKALIIKDENEELQEAYVWDEEPIELLAKSIEVCVDFYHSFHAALRHEVSGDL